MDLFSCQKKNVYAAYASSGSLSFQLSSSFATLNYAFEFSSTFSPERGSMRMRREFKNKNNKTILFFAIVRCTSNVDPSSLCTVQYIYIFVFWFGSLLLRYIRAEQKKWKLFERFSGDLVYEIWTICGMEWHGHSTFYSLDRKPMSMWWTNGRTIKKSELNNMCATVGCCYNFLYAHPKRTDIDHDELKICVCFFFVCNSIPLLREIKQVTKMLNTMLFLIPIFVSFHFVLFTFSSAICSRELCAALVHCAHSTSRLMIIIRYPGSFLLSEKIKMEQQRYL